MIETREFLTCRDWIKHTAEETADFLSNEFAERHEYMKLLLGHMCATATFEERLDDLLFWACVFARFRHRGLNETARRELQQLLDDSKRWGL